MAINPWTTNARKCAPSAADGVSLTPSATDWVNSAWGEITASTAAAWLLNGISIWPGTSVLTNHYEIDVGVGAAGSEVVVATFTALHAGNGTGGNTEIKTPLLIDAIGSGARVAARARGTENIAVKVAALFYEKPITGSLYSTAQPTKVLPAAAAPTSLTCSSTTWANGSYAQVIASTSADLVLVGVQYQMQFNGFQGEIDIAVGGAGSEVVKTTIRDSSGGGSGEPFTITLPVALDTFPSGSRIAVRGRTNSGAASTFTVKLIYQEKALGSGVPAGAVTTTAHKIAPSAADALTVTPTNSTTYGSWVEFIASAAADLHLAGIIPVNFLNGEVQIGIGAAGSEVVIATEHLFGANGTRNINFLPMTIPVAGIASGSRVSMRTRGSATPVLALAYYQSYSAQLYTTLVPKAVPDSATLTTVTPNGSAWVNSSWFEVTSGLSNIVGVYGLTYNPGSSDKHVEIDIGTGGAGSEVVATTLRTSTGGAGWWLLQLTELLKVATSTRLAVRMRLANPTSFGWTVGLEYLDAFNSGAVTPSLFNALLISP